LHFSSELLSLLLILAYVVLIAVVQKFSP